MTRRNRRNCQSAAKNRTHAGDDISQTIGLASDHRTRGFPSHVDGLGSVSSYALSQPNSIVTSSGGCNMPGHGGQKANVSAWSNPLRIVEASQVSKNNVVTKMPIYQSTQHLLRTDPPIAQAKPAPKLGKKVEKKAEKKVEKKKRKPFYGEVKKDIRGPTYWKRRAEENARLLNVAREIWRDEVGKKTAGKGKWPRSVRDVAVSHANG
ncbi:hypothetical protein BD769DRAFT_711604 [Suillus cothurnatus]|nr:hypothetical protein BD769DRAFT_711604 [Suillus cothurnatus]